MPGQYAGGGALDLLLSDGAVSGDQSAAGRGEGTGLFGRAASRIDADADGASGEILSGGKLLYRSDRGRRFARAFRQMYDAPERLKATYLRLKALEVLTILCAWQPREERCGKLHDAEPHGVNAAHSGAFAAGFAAGGDASGAGAGARGFA